MYCIVISVQVHGKFQSFNDIDAIFCGNNCKLAQYVREKNSRDKIEGALGFEPRTYRSAVDCSTTELYTQVEKS